jgi:hypothetical protein
MKKPLYNQFERQLIYRKTLDGMRYEMDISIRKLKREIIKSTLFGQFIEKIINKL